VRTSLKDRIARVIFSIGEGEMVLLLGFIKKTRTTPNDDLDLAIARLKTYRRS
jgi:phage-related protein